MPQPMPERTEPDVSTIIRQFAEFVGDAVLVGHNIKPLTCTTSAGRPPGLVRCRGQCGRVLETSGDIIGGENRRIPLPLPYTISGSYILAGTDFPDNRLRQVFFCSIGRRGKSFPALLPGTIPGGAPLGKETFSAFSNPPQLC